MSSNNNDASRILADSIGSNETTIPGYEDTFTTNAGFGNQNNNEYQNTPIRSGSPHNLDDIDGSTVSSQNSIHQYTGSNVGQHAYVMYKGISIDDAYYYGQIVGEPCPIPAALPIVGPINAADIEGLPVELMTHYVFRSDTLGRGPCGVGYWIKFRFSGNLPAVLNQVRVYSDEHGTFIYKFCLTEAKSDRDSNTHPVEVGGVRSNMNTPTRPPLVQIRTVVQPAAEADNFTNTATLGVQPLINRYNNMSSTTGPTMVTRQTTRMNISRTAVNAIPSSVGSAAGTRIETSVPLPTGASAYAAAPVGAAGGGSGTTTGPTTHSGLPTSSATSRSSSRGHGIPAPRAPSFPSHQYTFNPARGGSGASAPPPPSPDPSNISYAGYMPVYPVSAPSASMFITQAAVISFTLKVLSLSAVFVFFKKIQEHDMHYSDPREHYPISKAIGATVMRTILNGATAAEFASMPKEQIWDLLRSWVVPHGRQLMLAAFKSRDTVYFKKSYEYDIAQAASRMQYLMDIQTYLADCELFFLFITETMTPETISALLPPMRTRSKGNGLIEITLSKIPGVRKDSEHNYARAAYNDIQYAHYFKTALHHETPLPEAYLSFLSGLTEATQHGIETYYVNMEESLKYDQSQNLPYSPLVQPPETNSAQDRKFAEKLAAYNAAKKTLNIKEKSTSHLNSHTSQGNSSVQQYLQALDDEDDTPEAVDVKLPPVVDDAKYSYLLTLLEVCNDCHYTLNAMRGAPEAEKDHVRQTLTSALKPAHEYVARRKTEAERTGQHNDVASMKQAPLICLRFFRGGLCKNTNCKYSHQWKDVFAFCEFIQDDYKRQKALRGTAGNHPPKKPIIDKLQQHSATSSDDEDEGPTESTDTLDNAREGNTSTSKVDEDSDFDY